MKKLKVILILLIVLMISGCSKSKLSDISYQEFNKKMEKKDTFMVEIISDSCHFCQKFKPTFEKALEETNKESYVLAINQLSKEEYQEFSAKYKINSTPTVMFIKNGEDSGIFKRIIGAADLETTIKLIKDYAK